MLVGGVRQIAQRPHTRHPHIGVFAGGAFGVQRAKLRKAIRRDGFDHHRFHMFIAPLQNQLSQLGAVGAEIGKQFVDDAERILLVAFDAQHILRHPLGVAEACQRHRRVVGDAAVFAFGQLVNLAEIIVCVKIRQPPAGIAHLVFVAGMQNIGKQLHRVQRRIHAVDHGGFVAAVGSLACFCIGAEYLGRKEF